LPSQNKLPKQLKFSELEHKEIYDQITKFLNKGVIVKASNESSEFISNFFFRPKKNPALLYLIMFSLYINVL
jgi:hypothetical protein